MNTINTMPLLSKEIGKIIFKLKFTIKTERISLQFLYFFIEKIEILGQIFQ